MSLGQSNYSAYIPVYAMIEMWADGMVHLCLQADGTNHVEEGKNAAWSQWPLYYVYKMTGTLSFNTTNKWAICAT